MFLNSTFYVGYKLCKGSGFHFIFFTRLTNRFWLSLRNERCRFRIWTKQFRWYFASKLIKSPPSSLASKSSWKSLAMVHTLVSARRVLNWWSLPSLSSQKRQLSVVSNLRRGQTLLHCWQQHLLLLIIINSHLDPS